MNKSKIKYNVFDTSLDVLKEKNSIDLLCHIFECHGEFIASKILKDEDLESEEVHSTLLSIIGEIYSKRRVISFHDNQNTHLNYNYIISYSKGWTDNDEPTIILNNFEDSIKDNPVRNVILIYDDIETRDEDFIVLIEKI